MCRPRRSQHEKEHRPESQCTCTGEAEWPAPSWLHPPWFPRLAPVIPDPSPNDARPGTSLLPLLLVVLGCLAVVSPLLIGNLRSAEVDASIDVFFAGDQRSRGSFEKLETMMTERIAVLVLLRFDGIFSDAGAALVHELGERLAALDGVPRVFSLTRAKRPVRADGFSLDLRELVRFEPFLPRTSLSEEEWVTVEGLVTDYPWARDLLVSKDGRWTMLVAEVDRELSTHESRVALREEVAAAVAPIADRVLEFHVGSFPFIEAEMREDIEGDARRFLWALPVLLTVILLVTFRSVIVLLCVLAFEVLGVGFLPVLFAWNGASVNLYTGILFPLIAGLQLTLLTHFFAALRWAQHRGLPLRDALPAALAHVIRPSAVAALTTAIGLLSLLACDVGLVREFGWLGAQALGACFVATFLPPYLLALWLRRGGRGAAGVALHAADRTDVLFGRLGSLVNWLVARRRSILVVAALLVAASLFGLSHVRTDFRAIEFLDPGSESRRAMTAVDQEMGGMNLFELQIDCGRPGGIQDPEALHFLERLEQFAASKEGVTNVYGYAQIYAMLNELWQRGAPGTRVVPANPLTIAVIGQVVHGQEFLFEESIYDAARQRTTLFIRTRDMPAKRYLEILGEIVAWAQAESPPGVTVDGKSGLHSVLESDRRIVSSQVRSLALCVSAVFLTLFVLWRSLRLALVAILVNVPPLAAVLALHGFAGIALNSITVMVGAVVLGIAVDNCIHVLSFWKEERGRFDDPREALRWVLAHKLVPMTCTTAVLVSGFGLFLFSSFPPLADFGRLSILALLVALASTTLLLPPLLAVLGPGSPEGPARG